MLCEKVEELLNKDAKHIWHPFTNLEKKEPPLLFVKGEGAFLYTHDEKKYLDGISSWWVNLHGHAHPYIVDKIAKQAALLEQVIFTDYTHPSAISFASRLLNILPKGFSKVFYTDNGSTAVETALKMAIICGSPKKKIVSFKGGYHGDTFGAMSGGGRSHFNAPFWSFMFEVISIDIPLKGREEISLRQMEEALGNDDVLCFLYEPLILGSGGMKIYSKKGLEALLQSCRKKGVLLIADEVMTGFGRTGPLFASSMMQTLPDIITLSKGITGGFLPLGATVCTQHVFNAFLQKEKMFLHGHSYTANPLACAAALASLDLLEKGSREHIIKGHEQFCQKWKDHPSLLRLEFLGTILVIEYASENASYYSSIREKLIHHFLQHHILLRPLGNVLYVMPPYCIEEEDLQTIYKTIEMTL